MITYFKIIKILQGDIKRHRHNGNENVADELEQVLAKMIITIEPFIIFLKENYEPKLYIFMKAYFFNNASSISAGYAAGEYGVEDNVRTYFRRACEQYDSLCRNNLI